MASPTGLSVFLNVSNVEKSAAFYEGLGFKKETEFPGMRVIAYKVGSSTMLIGPADGTDDPKVKSWLAMKPWGVGTVIMPQVKSVEALYKSALALGAEIEEPPTVQPWGSKTVQVVDPDGYSLIFDEPLKAPAKKKRAAKPARASNAKKKTKAKRR